MSESEDRARRADEALTRFWKQVEAGQPLDVREFLAQNDGLRDLLEPRLAAYRKMQSDLGKVAEESSDGPQPFDAVIEKLKQQGDSSARYELKGEIARGGMGAILRVWDSHLRRSSAMKVVLGTDEDESTGKTTAVDSQTLGRFLEEAQVTAQLDHPGIVPVHELGLDSQGRVYFTMRLVQGRDLQQVFEMVKTGEDGWNQTRALGVLLKVCEAMAYAHSKGVIHRDLKPANIMVGRFGEVYVMDWGLAKVMGEEDAHDLRLDAESRSSISMIKTARRDEAAKDPDTPLVTMDGTIMGTPAYMSPEQARGEIEHMDQRSDVYSLGAILYQLLTGEVPYAEPGASPHAVWMRVVEGRLKPLSELDLDVVPELITICERAMQRDPDQRYANTVELMEHLRRVLERSVILARRNLVKWASKVRWLLDLGLLGSMLVFAMAVVFTFSVFSDPLRRDEEGETVGSSMRLNLPVEVSWDGGGVEYIGATSGPRAQWFTDPELELSGSLSTLALGLGPGLCVAGANLLLIGCVLYILFQLREIFISMGGGLPFTLSNVKRLRRIGYVLILVAIGRTVVHSILPEMLLVYLEFDGVDVTTPLQISWEWWLAGLGALSLAELFKLGVAIEGRPKPSS